jgi:hypothetical protein
MESVRRAIAVEVENPLPELYAVEEQYRRIVEEVAVYVAERGTLKKERYKGLYQRFRKQYRLPAQLIQQAMNQGVETGRSFLEAERETVEFAGPVPRFGRSLSACYSWSFKNAVGSAAPIWLALSLPGGRRVVWIVRKANAIAPRPAAYASRPRSGR